MNQTSEKSFHEKLKSKIDSYVHGVYRVTKKFPKEEVFGSTSQIRRSSLSVALNYVEGYARRRSAVHKNFLEIAYGSLQESKYLLDFAEKENYINKEESVPLINLADEIGAMLWSTMSKL
jgi:four helix bundle protein